MSLRIQELSTAVDVLTALLWRHNNAENLTSLLTAKHAWYLENQSDFWENWYRDVFDIRTCNEFGCAVWAIILGVKLNFLIAPSSGPKSWGFGTFNVNFGNGNFGLQQSSSVFLTLEQKRTILRLRYLTLTGRMTVPEINRTMAYVFRNDGPVYVLDGLDMTMVYVFKFAPTPLLRFILDNLDILPRPAAVKVSYIVSTRPVFGFGDFNKNFNNGTFATPLEN